MHSGTRDDVSSVGVDIKADSFGSTEGEVSCLLVSSKLVAFTLDEVTSCEKIGRRTADTEDVVGAVALILPTLNELFWPTQLTLSTTYDDDFHHRAL